METETERACLALLQANFVPLVTIPGRVLHCDADFLAYQSGHSWEEDSPQESIDDLVIRIEELRNTAQAEIIVLHLTLGTKGGRHEVARVKEYQGDRKKDEGLRERVTLLREYMAKMWTSTTSPHAQYDQEADDSLCQAMWAHEEGEPPVLWSIDKDLNMVGGLRLNHETEEVEACPWGFGKTDIDRSKSAAKINGNGTSFFWHQILVGDTADGIPGLPEFSPRACAKHFPSAPLIKAREAINSCDPGKFKAAQKRLNKVISGIKPKKAGACAVVSYLESASTEKEAMRLVLEAYEAYYPKGSFLFECWDGEFEQKTAKDMMIEQARLLWMRRERGQDVLDYLKGVATS